MRWSGSSPPRRVQTRLADARAWLEAAAVGAAVTTLMRTPRARDAEQSRRALLQALRLGPPSDLGALLAGARRLGLDLSRGAMAICAGRQAETPLIPSDSPGLSADVGEGLVRSASSADAEAQDLIGASCRGAGCASPSRPRAGIPPCCMTRSGKRSCCWSFPRASAQEETYRLLIGVLLRNPEELELFADPDDPAASPNTTRGTTPSCSPRSRRSWPATAPPPRRPRP